MAPKDIGMTVKAAYSGTLGSFAPNYPAARQYHSDERGYTKSQFFSTLF